MTNHLKKRMINLKLLNRKSHKFNKISLFQNDLNLTTARLVESLRLRSKKSLKNWCLNLWKKLKNLFFKSLLSVQAVQKLFMKELHVINVANITSKELDTNVQFVLISTYVKIVKLHQVTAIHSSKSNIQNKPHIKFSLSSKMIRRTLLKSMDIEFNYHNFQLWTSCLMPLVDLFNLNMEDSTLGVTVIDHTVLLNETLRRSKNRKKKKNVLFKNLKRRQKYKRKSLLKRLNQKLKRNL